MRTYAQVLLSDTTVSPRSPGFDPGPVHVGLMVAKVA
jgi:hypothetical protein